MGYFPDGETLSVRVFSESESLEARMFFENWTVCRTDFVEEFGGGGIFIPAVCRGQVSRESCCRLEPD